MSNTKSYCIAAIAWAIALGLSIIVVRAFMPSTTQIPADLKIVKLKKEVAPFFEVAFRREDLGAEKFLLQDPITIVRGKPLLPEIHGVGPHDLLGFRNREISNTTDIITIGDSQTYGINVVHAKNWPSWLARTLDTSVYNMSLGGWGAVQYLSMFEKAVAFQPQAVVIAFYTGNDSLESFRAAYAVDYWKALRPDKALDLSAMPSIPFPPTEDSLWKYEGKDGFQMIFSPEHRLLANKQSDIAVTNGYKIIHDVIKKISSRSTTLNINTFFTIIPTKELVYSDRLRGAETKLSPKYQELITDEQQHINAIKEIVQTAAPERYIDLLNPLSEAASRGESIYPPDRDGHPLELGYQIIGNTIGEHIRSAVVPLRSGLYRVAVTKQIEWFYQVADDKSCRVFERKELLAAKGLSSTSATPGLFSQIQRCRLMERVSETEGH